MIDRFLRSHFFQGLSCAVCLVGFALLLKVFGGPIYTFVTKPDAVVLYCHGDPEDEERESFVLVIEQERVESDKARIRAIRSDVLFEKTKEQRRKIKKWTEARFVPDYSWPEAMATLDLIVAEAFKQHSASMLVLGRYTGRVSIEEKRENGEEYVFKGTCLRENERKF